MRIREILNSLNIFSECKKYKIPLWQCPQFLFLIFGCIIILSILFTYFVGTKYIQDPITLTIFIFLLTIILFVLAFSIINSFENLLSVSRIKSEFIEIVSHSLRTPLTNLNWTIDFFIAKNLGKIEKDQIEQLQFLKENLKRIDDLISRLLIVSRVEDHTLFQSKEEISIEEILTETIEKFKNEIEKLKLDLEIKIQKDLPKIFVAPFYFKIVLENLLDNAIRYNREKGKIEIELEKRGKNIYFEIKDTGVGIPKKDQKYIFQKFFRSENIAKFKTSGTGLSLFITKKIIENFGGKIGFESLETKWSKFWFLIPIKK
jgi:two-component system phosphate regulon sensor histidine kinase PhoR